MSAFASDLHTSERLVACKSLSLWTCQASCHLGGLVFSSSSVSTEISDKNSNMLPKMNKSFGCITNVVN